MFQNAYVNCLRLCTDVILIQFLDLVAHGGVLAAVVGAMWDIWVNWCTLKKSCIKYDSFELVESIVWSSLSLTFKLLPSICFFCHGLLLSQPAHSCLTLCPSTNFPISLLHFPTYCSAFHPLLYSHMASLLLLCDGETNEIHFFILLLSMHCIALLISILIT